MVVSGQEEISGITNSLTMKTWVSVTCLHELVGSLCGEGWPDNYEQTWNGRIMLKMFQGSPVWKGFHFISLKKKKKNTNQERDLEKNVHKNMVHFDIFDIET